MKEIKYQQKYVRQLAEGGTGTDVSHPCQVLILKKPRQGSFDVDHYRPKCNTGLRSSVLLSNLLSALLYWLTSVNMLFNPGFPVTMLPRSWESALSM